MSSDQIGFNGKDVNLYRYVRNNPLKYTDPFGLTLQFACGAAQKEFEDDIEKIMTSPAGRRLLKKLHDSSTSYKIHRGKDNSAWQQGNKISVDPNFSPTIQTSSGPQNVSTTRILAHELGHLTGTYDDGLGAMNNVNQYENPIMTPIDGYSRTQY